MNTQDLDFWRERIRTHGSVESGMAIGFNFPEIDRVHHEFVIENIKPSDMVLDAGCGYGRITKWFSPRKYIGVDFLPEFIEEAKKRNPNHLFLISDLDRLPFRDQTFDWAILVSMRGVIKNSSEEKWLAVEKEIRRVALHALIMDYGKSVPELIKESVKIL